MGGMRSKVADTGYEMTHAFQRFMAMGGFGQVNPNPNNANDPPADRTCSCRCSINGGIIIGGVSLLSIAIPAIFGSR